MRWRGRRVSSNVEDRRGQRGPMGAGGKGIGLGCGGVILVVVVALLTGVDPMQLLQLVSQVQAPQDPGPSQGLPGGEPGEVTDELGQFAGVVMADTEDTWRQLFRAMGQTYQDPTLVLFSGSVASACGYAGSASGPFYCPADGKVYLDLSFFDELERRFGAPGDFAQAYVIAHEVGHHVQNLLGISEQVQRARQQLSRSEANELSVRLELQADCLAGVWGHHAHKYRQLLEPGDLQEAMGAAAAIGDDNIQRQSTGRVVPESWTHGSSEQRQRWLTRGLESGDPNACETFE